MSFGRRTYEVGTKNNGVCEWARVEAVPRTTVLWTVLWDSGSLFLIIPKEPEYFGANWIWRTMINLDPGLLIHSSRTNRVQAIPMESQK